MLATARLLRHEALRAAHSRRWVLAVLVCCAVAFLAADHVAVEMRNTGASATAWDVHATAVNSLMYVGYLLFTTFAFVVGDTLVSDCESGYGWMVLGRTQSRASWWTAKVASLILAALALQLMFLGACLLAGYVRGGLPISGEASELAVMPFDRHGMMLFPEVPTGSSMVLRQMLRVGYLSLAFSTLACVLVTLTIPVRRGWLPMTIALVGLMADYVLIRAWEPWHYASPGARLLEGSHVRWSAGIPLSWSSSVLYFVALLAVAGLLGGRALRRMDL